MVEVHFGRSFVDMKGMFFETNMVGKVCVGPSIVPSIHRRLRWLPSCHIKEIKGNQNYFRLHVHLSGRWCQPILLDHFPNFWDEKWKLFETTTQSNWCLCRCCIQKGLIWHGWFQNSIGQSLWKEKCVRNGQNNRAALKTRMSQDVALGDETWRKRNTAWQR